MEEILLEGETYNVQFVKNGKLKTLKAPKVVIATGGLPIPKMGATDFALRFAKKHGLTIVENGASACTFNHNRKRPGMVTPVFPVTLFTAV